MSPIERITITDMHHDRVEGTFEGSEDEILKQMSEEYPWAKVRCDGTLAGILRYLGGVGSMAIEVKRAG
jgi:hypothetical protein